MILESYQITSPQHQKAYKIDLAEGLDAVHLDHIEQEWSPLLKSQKDRGLLEFFSKPTDEQTEDSWAKIQSKMNFEDSHWNWRLKRAALPSEHNRIFSLLNGDEVEAAMVLNTAKNSHDDTTRQSNVYIEYVAVAPWNRKSFQSPQRFRGLGSVLIGFAVAVSESLGFGGRCGLHALPQAEGFYRQIGMRDLGIDSSHDSLRYFEFDTDGAANFRK